MTYLNKYNLPCAYKLSHIKFDLKQLKQALIPFVSQFEDIYEANKGLCLNHQKLASSVKDHFFQVSLTVCSTPMKEHHHGRKFEEAGKGKMSRSQRHRLTTSRRTDFPYMDEHNWNVPTKLFQNSYFYRCVKHFKAPAIRVRLTTLDGGGTIIPHIDYNVDYAVRIVVPIYTNEQCWNYFWKKGRKVKFHIPADGHPWFLNVGLKHSVENLGTNNRTVLMFSLAGTKDIIDLFNRKNRFTQFEKKIKFQKEIQSNISVQTSNYDKTV